MWNYEHKHQTNQTVKAQSVCDVDHKKKQFVSNNSIIVFKKCCKYKKHANRLLPQSNYLIPMPVNSQGQIPKHWFQKARVTADVLKNYLKSDPAIMGYVVEWNRECVILHLYVMESFDGWLSHEALKSYICSRMPPGQTI